MIIRKFISSILLVTGSFYIQEGPAFAEGNGDTDMHYVDKELHPNAAVRSAIIAGTFDANFPVRKPNFIEDKFDKALNEYQTSWGRLPQNITLSRKKIHIGETGKRVAAFSKRLGLNQNRFDNILANKIRDYRSAHNLPSGEHVDNQLIVSLNRGASYYLRKININKHRAAELPFNLGKKFILVNVATQQLYMYEDNILVNQMRVIVGTADNPTPMLSGFIRFSVINPYWNIPYDLTRDRYAKRIINGGENYLKTRRFEVLSGWEDDARTLSYKEVDWNAVASGEMKVRLRQKPGPGNGMGDIKFMFPNRFGVYLHDTHNEASFKLDNRMISAGCVRVEKPWMLAQWLYGKKPQAKSDAPEQSIVLTKKTPVYISYFTAMPKVDGFSFHKDTYGRDERLKESLESPF